MKKSREELEKECAEAEAIVKQYQHRGQRLENHIYYYTEGERMCKRIQLRVQDFTIFLVEFSLADINFRFIVSASFFKI